MSPLFAALPPADLPTHAYVAPTGVHAAAPQHVAPVSSSAASAVSDSLRTHTVRDGDTLWDLARHYGVSTSALVRANDLATAQFIHPGQTLRIPGSSGSGGSSSSGGSSPGSNSSGSSSSGTRGGPGATITVSAGDTLWGIAHRHEVSVATLASLNNLTDNRMIYPGQTLRLSPGSSDSGSSSASGGSSSSGSSSSGSSSSSSRSDSTTVTVRSGDTLWDIAHRHEVSVASLTSLNDLTDNRMIHPGQSLRISPGSDGSGGSGSDGSGSSGSDGSSGSVTTPGPDGGPWTSSSIGDRYADADVDDTFLHYRYSSATARAATANRDHLSSIAAPGQEQVRQMIVDTSQRHGVDPDLMLALSYQESGWNQRAVSPANAIGAMQVIPASGDWASALVGRPLNLLDPQDNVTAGVVIMRALQRSADSSDDAIGGYYQGLASVREHGQFADTKRYVSNIRAFMRTS